MNTYTQAEVVNVGMNAQFKIVLRIRVQGGQHNGKMVDVPTDARTLAELAALGFRVYNAR